MALESASLNVVFDLEELNRLTVTASDEAEGFGECFNQESSESNRLAVTASDDPAWADCIETISRNWIGLSERK